MYQLEEVHIHIAAIFVRTSISLLLLRRYLYLIRTVWKKSSWGNIQGYLMFSPGRKSLLLFLILHI